MSISYEHSIVPMSELRTDLEKIRAQLKKSPVIITTNGRPDFGVCDLETLEIASKIKDLKDLLKKRIEHKDKSEKAQDVFKALDQKYGG